MGIDKVQIHKGLPLSFMMAKYVHPTDMDLPIRDFPNINFVIYHAGFPYIDEMTSLKQGRPQRTNVYVDIGTTFGMQVNAPVALVHTMGKLLQFIGADHICGGRTTPCGARPSGRLRPCASSLSQRN